MPQDPSRRAFFPGNAATAAFVSALAIASALAGCQSDAPSELVLSQTTYDAIPGWSVDAADRAFAQFRRQCVRLATLPAGQDLGGSGEAARLAGRPADYAASCLAARQATIVDAASGRRFFEIWFAPYAIGDVRYTGYFEPEYNGSLVRGGAYQTPVLARPADLVTVDAPDGGGTVSGRADGGVVVPYASRRDIDQGALAGRGLEILYLADPVDLFFLQIQGSGRIRLPSGQVVRLGYAGKNGQAYVPIGRVMVERNLLAPDDVSAAHIRDWLEANKAQSTALMEQNPNYVFFRALSDVSLAEGAPGTLGVDLAPARSVAVDRRVIPLGVPFFYDAADPALAEPLRALALAEDTGTDVTGASRADIFFGWGKAAGLLAGGLHANGTATLLLPRPVRAN